MPIPLPIIAAVIGIGSAAVGTASQISANNKASKAQREANRIQREANNFQSARERQDAVRDARISYAEQVSTQESQGVGGSSAGQGALSSTSSQARGNLNFMDQYNLLMDQAGASIGRANRYASKASEAGSVASFGFSAFGASGGFGAFK